MSEREYLTPKEVAKILRVTRDTVLRRFIGLPGVIDIGSEEKMHKRRYRVVRIPRTALERYIIEHKAA